MNLITYWKRRVSFIFFQILHLVGFCWECWVCVRFVLGFRPFCWVLNVKIWSWRNVNICKCWVWNGETQQKPTGKRVFPNETQQNPTSPTDIKREKKAHGYYVLTFERFFNVGLLGLKCRKHKGYKKTVHSPFWMEY